MKKPLWSTRAVDKTLNPVWEETAFGEDWSLPSSAVRRHNADQSTSCPPRYQS